MAYDHRSKAGNQGDVVKHVALLAVACHVLERAPRSLHYVDAFAGPAGSLLTPGGEWTRGIGRLNRAANPISPDVASWMRTVLTQREQRASYRCPDLSVGGEGLAPEFEERGGERARDRIYEGREA